MLKISPIDDKTVCNPLLEKWSCDESSKVLLAQENGKAVGYIIVKEEKAHLQINGFEVIGCKDYTSPILEHKQLSEMLIRSAGSYALNRQLFYLESEVNDLFFVACLLGFNSSDKKVKINLYELFKPCNHCKN